MRNAKYISRMLLALLAVMLIWCGSAAAADRNLTAGVVTGNVGETVSVPITVDDAAGIGGIAFTIGYDPRGLQFVDLVEDQKTLDKGSGASYTTDQMKSSLFYQFNDEKVPGTTTSTGRVLVAAATADGLTGANLRLFKAQFTIKPGAAGVYPIQLMGTILTNPGAGYNTPQFIPILVGTSDKNAGMYTSTVFPQIAAILNPGSIGISVSGKAISGKAYYGADTTLPAGGCTVILKKTAMDGVNFVFDSQTTTVGDPKDSRGLGAFSFANKPAGNYRVFVQSKDPGYVGSGDIAVTMATVPVNVVVPDVLLAAAAATYERFTGTVSKYYPGMQLQVFAADNLTTPLGIFPVGSDGTWATMQKSGLYKFYVVYGKLKQELTPGGVLTTLDGTWSLKTISGTIYGLPTDAMVTIMARSVAAGVQKMIRQTVGSAGSYEFADLIPATDYFVAMGGAGKPLSYYSGVDPFTPVTDITLAGQVDISSANKALVNFNFGSTDTTGKISGAVTEGTIPVIGIAVYAFDRSTYALTMAITGAGGAYEFKLIPSTAGYEIFVIKANGKIFYYNQTAAATQNEAEATLIPVAQGDNDSSNDINIAECAYSLSGKVTFKREGGDPAANILITAFSGANSGRAVSMTGQDGAYTLTGLCAADYNVIMQPLLGRYAVQKKTSTIPATAALNFVIDSGNVLSGTVKDDVSSGNAVNNAIIYLLDQATGTLINNRMYFSAAGKYEVGDVATGVYSLKGSHPDYPTYTKADLGVSADTVQNILFTKGARFTGTVTEKGSATKLADALVIVTRVGEVPVSVITNSEGKYAVYGLNENNADYTIIVQKKDYLRKATPDQMPGTTDSGTVVNVELEKPAVTFDLTGTVSKFGGAGVVPNVWVMLTAKGGDFFVSTLTNASGVYSFTKLPRANDYRRVVISGGSLPTSIESSLDWSEATTDAVSPKDVTIAWGNATKITGTVTRTTGSGVISVFLYKAADNSFVAFTKAGSDGSYEFQGLASGTYKVLAVSPGNSPKWHGDQATSITNAAAVSLGATANIAL